MKELNKSEVTRIIKIIASCNTVDQLSNTNNWLHGVFKFVDTCDASKKSILQSLYIQNNKMKLKG